MIEIDLSTTTWEIYNKISSTKKVGSLVLEEKIDEYETLGDLLARLASGDSEAWAVLFDLQTRQIALCCDYLQRQSVGITRRT